MYAGTLSYYAQLQAHNTMLNQTQKTFSTLIAGQGVFGYEPKVSYLFGIPKSISAGAIVLDIPITVTQAISDNYQRADMYASALEHIVPEQMFSTPTYKVDGFSTAKAFQKANAQGQKLFFINQENRDEILPQLHHSTQTMSAIIKALDAGKELTTHESPISVPGYTGTGYRIFDPVTGSSADMISGGLSGGFADIAHEREKRALNAMLMVYSAITGAVAEYALLFSTDKRFKVLSIIAAFLSFYAGMIMANYDKNPLLSLVQATLLLVLTALLIVLVVSQLSAAGIVFAPLVALVITGAVNSLTLLSFIFKKKYVYYV